MSKYLFALRLVYALSLVRFYYHNHIAPPPRFLNLEEAALPPPPPIPLEELGWLDNMPQSSESSGELLIEELEEEDVELEDRIRSLECLSAELQERIVQLQARLRELLEDQDVFV